MKSRLGNVAVVACRVVLGLVFVFSGAMKTLDPWGTAMKVGEYLSAFGMDWLSSWSLGLGIVQCVGELTLGLMLLFNVRIRLTAPVTTLLMIAFTLLTLGVAIWNPLDDCGCFGDALKIKNWHSFAKNVVLLALSVVVWRAGRSVARGGRGGSRTASEPHPASGLRSGSRGGGLLAFSRRELVLTVLFVAASAALALWGWRHLPIVDLFPYKVGTDLRTEVYCSSCEDKVIRLIYRDNASGSESEFTMTDTTWYDAARWEYIATRSPYDSLPPRMLEYNFAIYRGGVDHADEVVFADGTTYLVFMRGEHSLPGECGAAGCGRGLDRFLAGVGDEANVIVAMGFETKIPDSQGAESQNLEIESPDDVGLGMPELSAIPESITIAGRELPCYGMDAGLMALLLRADVGVVEVTDGVITAKHTCWDY